MDEMRLNYKESIEKVNSRCMIPIPELIQCIADISEGDEIHWIIEQDEIDKNQTHITLEWI